MKNNPIAIIICLIIIGITIVSAMASMQPPADIVIQDIWIVDSIQSDKWINFFMEKGGNIHIDNARVNVYLDRDHFKEIWELKRSERYNDMN